MNKYIKHLITITKHKWYVGVECFKIGLYWQGIIHDLSKYSPKELFISAKFYQGKSSPIEAERIKHGYSIAWISHYHNNPHHFQYWVDINKDRCIPIDMPDKYILEACCDFIGAGKAYNNVKKGDTSEPIKYWREKIDKTFISERTQKMMDIALVNYANKGKVSFNI